MSKEKSTKGDTLSTNKTQAPKVGTMKLEGSHQTPSRTPVSSMVALGAGCYWGTEKFIKEGFQEKFPDSIKSARVGFMSPDPDSKIRSPTPQWARNSKHVQVLHVELVDPQEHFEELIRFFFSFHDPTLESQQGKDRGFQFASYIFCEDKVQAEIASRVKRELQELIDTGRIVCFRHQTVTTLIRPAHEFSEAPRYQQDFFTKKHPMDWYYW